MDVNVEVFPNDTWVLVNLAILPKTPAKIHYQSYDLEK